jgi:hypothetical protein
LSQFIHIGGAVFKFRRNFIGAFEKIFGKFVSPVLLTLWIQGLVHKASTADIIDATDTATQGSTIFPQLHSHYDCY